MIKSELEIKGTAKANESAEADLLDEVELTLEQARARIKDTIEQEEEDADSKRDDRTTSP